jgi:tetratricopeptide (TPR) repeat protein
MELRRFNNLSEAEAWYRALANGRCGEVDSLFLALCRGEDERAEILYRRTTFPSRWWANVAYAQGHYLIRLRRRDRLIGLAGRLGVDTGLAKTSDDPWADLRTMAQSMEARARASASGPEDAVAHCLLGHAYLAMDYHELANAAYRSALQLDPFVWVPWENTRLLTFLREEPARQ